MAQVSPLARVEIIQAVAPNPIADEAQGGKSQVGRNAAHLAVAAFTDAEFKPAGRNGLAFANGGIPQPHRRLGHQAYLGGQRHAIFEPHHPAPLL